MVLNADEEAMIVAFWRYTRLPMVLFVCLTTNHPAFDAIFAIPLLGGGMEYRDFPRWTTTGPNGKISSATLWDISI